MAPTGTTTMEWSHHPQCYDFRARVLGWGRQTDVTVSVSSPRKQHLLTDAEGQVAAYRCPLISYRPSPHGYLVAVNVLSCQMAGSCKSGLVTTMNPLGPGIDFVGL